MKPRRTSLPKGMEGDTLTLEAALGLLSLPRLVGIHPDRGEPIEAGIGRFGPFVRMGSIFASLDKDDDVVSVGINRAVDALAKKLDSVRSLGAHPKDKAAVMVKKGRFGPYAQHGSIVANLPKDADIDDFSLEDAVALLAERGKALKGRGGKSKPAAKPKAAAKPRAAAAAKAPAQKAAPKKAATKKPAAKKVPAKAPARKAG